MAGFGPEWNAASIAARRTPAPHPQVRAGRVRHLPVRPAGRWTGKSQAGDEVIEVTPDRWMGTRDRSWGIRPVGETGSARHPGRGRPDERDVELLPGPLRRVLAGLHAQRDRNRRAHHRGSGPHLGRSRARDRVAGSARTRARRHRRDPHHRARRRTIPRARRAVRSSWWVRRWPGASSASAPATAWTEDWRHGMYQGPLAVQGLDFSNEEDGPAWPVRDGRTRPASSWTATLVTG